ncbi:hypothetical protein [Streptomyces sp. NRRL B-1347]|uniref:hypothetical protein n=1 Tax=Streptomyces sp. NRRL B-1347 TaxID=1476877 RepID=UPI00068A5A8A
MAACLDLLGQWVDMQTRMVPSMPSSREIPTSMARLMMPWKAGPAAVTPEVEDVVAALAWHVCLMP